MTKPFEFTLTDEEATLIRDAKGTGGQQTLHRRLTSQLDANANKISLDDGQFGELIRYMSQYGSGGFQGRLQQAFGRSLRELLGLV